MTVQDPTRTRTSTHRTPALGLASALKATSLVVTTTATQATHAYVDDVGSATISKKDTPPDGLDGGRRGPHEARLDDVPVTADVDGLAVDAAVDVRP